MGSSKLSLQQERSSSAPAEPQESFQFSSTPLGIIGKPTPPETSADIDIVASPDIPSEAIEALRTTAGKALSYFREHFGEVGQPLRFAVGGATEALRAGYNFENKTIALPHLAGVHQAGVYSEDVITHEAFHAMMHIAYPNSYAPELMENRSAESLHEGLADLFSHRLQPDSHFGEGYYSHGAPFRSYRNDLSFQLSSGGHAQGNALTSILMEHEVSNHELRSFLEQKDFRVEGLRSVSSELSEALEHDASLAVTSLVKNYPASNKDRYWLRPGVPLEVSLQPNLAAQETYQQFRVEWSNKHGKTPEGFLFEQTEENTFVVAPKTNDVAPEKVIARFYDGDRLVGFRPFYFGARS